jgi:hypothetical protein
MRHISVTIVFLSFFTLGVLLTMASLPLLAMPAEKIFASPDDAVKAFLGACKADDDRMLLIIFGPDSEDIILTEDREQASQNRKKLCERAGEKQLLQNLKDGSIKLLVLGHQNWIFPIPLVKEGSGWRFDTEAGREELINRRVGMNELNAIACCRIYVKAQKIYASRDRDGDQVKEFAQRLGSTPGKKDGLYWPSDVGKEASPFGPLLAEKEGVLRQEEPYHGYYFRILTGQGAHAPGGAYGYIINGHMIGGFALVAYPAEYGARGVMTFVVNQQGKVYQKDMGKDTVVLAEEMKVFNPDRTWKEVHGEDMSGK